MEEAFGFARRSAEVDHSTAGNHLNEPLTSKSTLPQLPRRPRRHHLQHLKIRMHGLLHSFTNFRDKTM